MTRDLTRLALLSQMDAFTANQAAEFMQISRYAFDEWRTEHDLPYTVVGKHRKGDKRRYRREDILTAMAAN